MIPLTRYTLYSAVKRKEKIYILIIMGLCYYCEKVEREAYFGQYCFGCRQMKNLCNVYGYERVLDILKAVCIRDESQLERKILAKKGNADKTKDDVKPKEK
tara:strand:- start:174 stop:476 length:303 start_codon:yes stop_codon:yes gene_type:complete